MKSSIGVIVFILAIVLAATYLFLGGQEDIRRPTRITKRVKIDVPPPPLNNTYETESPEPFRREEDRDLFFERSKSEPEPVVVIPKKEDDTFKVEERLVNKPFEREQKQTSPQKKL